MVKYMRLLISVMLFSLTVTSAHAIRYPMLVDAKITSCTNGTGALPCTMTVMYAGSSQVLDIVGGGNPPPRQATPISAYGVHCAIGDGATGKPFSQCSWDIGGHAPRTQDCKTGAGTWDVGGSSCNTAPTWGHHNGAGPGGECVLFGIVDSAKTVLNTPFGPITAVAAANGGNRFCIKPLPPSIVCEVTLPPSIDHGAVITGTEDRKFIDGVINCGNGPIVNVVGGSDIELANGVKTKISSSITSGTHLRLQSDMSVKSNAKPGAYSTAIIVAVSPY